MNTVVYVLKQDSNDMFTRKGLAAVSTSLDKAIEMMKEWFEEEKKDKGRCEEIEATLDIDGEYSNAEIRNMDGAWITLDIEKVYTNDWLL